MNTLISFNRHISKLFLAGLAAMMLLMMATPSHAAVSVFLSAGNTCAGGTTVNFSTSGSSVQVSLCVTNTGEPFGLCGQTSKLQSANAGENGRFNLTARTLGASYADPNNTAIPFPFAVSNPPPTSDLGGTSTTGAPVAPAASQLLATFDLAPQASATNASYVLSTSSDSILSVDTDSTCNNPTDLAIPASITMNLVAPTFTVTPSAGANGSITPNMAQVVNSGNTTVFTVTPNVGFFASVAGTCGGTLVGTTYTTNAITANCTVSATFAPITFTVTPSVGANGSITPNTAQVINSGNTTVFTVTPNAGFAATVGGTCGGTLVGTTYTTNAITANCTVSATFAPITFTVTPSAGANGSITPNTAQVINSGNTTVFTVTPNAGFAATVGGTCGGTLVGTTYTTNAITANCTVSATFAANLALTAVQSRKTHAAAGTFDIAIDTVPLVTGNVTTEPRIIGAGHTIVFQFNQAIMAAGTLTVTDALGATISTANAVISGTNVIVTITGVTDVRARIALTGVTSATGMINAVASVGFLYGDVSNNRSVNASDIVSTRNRSGQATTNANFRYDVDTSGAIDATDAAAVKAKSVSRL